MEQFLDIFHRKFTYTTANAYETAWAGRIPDRFDPKKPAFIEAIQWIRDNQLSDGGWGSTAVKYKSDRVLSTLNCLICLKTWDFAEDSDRIRKGINAVNIYMNEAIDDQYFDHISIGFELIYPKLVKDAIGLGIPLKNPNNDEITAEANYKLQVLKDTGMLTQKFDKNKPKSWWFNLEAFEEIIDKSLIEQMVGDDGSVCGSFSATAFAYIANPNLKACYSLIENQIKKTGFLSHIPSYEFFELSWSVLHFYLAGYDVTSTEFTEIRIRLKTIWTKYDGQISWGTGGSPDFDDIVMFLAAIVSTKAMNVTEKDVTGLLECYKNGLFVTFPEEKDSSVTTNLNTLLCLKQLKQLPKVFHLVEKPYNNLIEYLRTQIRTDRLLTDKWHISPYYPTTRFIVTFTDIDNDLAKKVIDSVISKQNSDGGWGINGSTLEETSYVVLSLVYWMNRTERSEYITTSVLRAKSLLSEKTELPPLWLGKVLYLPKLVPMSATIAAIYALDQLS